MPTPPPRSTLFPYTTLFRSRRRHHHALLLPALRLQRVRRWNRSHALRAAEHRSDQAALQPCDPGGVSTDERSEEHTSELQSQSNLVCRLLLEKKKYMVERIT